MWGQSTTKYISTYEDDINHNRLIINAIDVATAFYHLIADVAVANRIEFKVMISSD